jgi:hypothetical protein
MKGYFEAPGLGADEHLREGMSLWEDAGLPPFAEDEGRAAYDAAVAAYDGPFQIEFAAACRCFRLFLALHARAEEFPASATLLGDYFFSKFSSLLIPLDNVRLIEAFSDFLEKDASSNDAGDYIDFIGTTLKAVLI